MGRFASSWELAKCSWGVLKTDKQLAAIPVFSFIATAVVVALFGGGAYFTLDITDKVGQSDTVSATPVTWVVGIVGYLAITFVVTFFASVLVAGAYQRLTGQHPTLGTAFSQAGSRIGAIFLWSMLTGTVGLILQAIKEKAGFIGVIVGNIVGMAWEIVTWLAVPVVVVEGTGPISSLKKSAGLFKKTWGENLIAQGGLGLLGLLAMLPGLLIALLVGLAVPVAGIAIAVLWVVAVSIVLSALTGIFKTALYLYANGQPIDAFPTAVLAGAFKTKKKKGKGKIGV